MNRRDKKIGGGGIYKWIILNAIDTIDNNNNNSNKEKEKEKEQAKEEREREREREWQ